MPNKNSGSSSTFHSLTFPLIFLLCLQITHTQICIRSLGSICEQCAPGYQLVNGTCLPISSSLPNTPTLVFLNKPGPQNLLYNVMPVVVSMQAGGTLNDTQKNVVNQFKVIPVPNSSLVNLYQLEINLTLVNNSDLGTLNSSIVKQATQTANQSVLEQSKQTYSNQSVNASDVGSLVGLDNLTLGYLENGEGLSIVKQRVDDQKNLTAIRQAVSASLTTINEAIQPNLVQVKLKEQTSNMVQNNAVVEPLLTQVKQRSKTSPAINQQPITPANIASSIKQTQSNSATTSEENTSLELQLVNQRLSKVGQATEPTFVQVKLNQPTQSAAPSNSSGIITLQQVGQQLTQINQQPIQIQLKKNENSNQSQQLQPVFTQTENNASLLPANLVKLQLIAPAQSPTQFIQINPATPSAPSTDFSWIKATRYELYNLTLVPQALTQVSLKPSSLSLNQSYIFQCTNNLTLFLQPSTNSTGWQLSYAQYTHRLIAKLSAQLKSHTLADRSTLCFDPPFQQSYQHISKKYKSLIASAPIFVVYYQFCGFSKSFRIYFIDDSAFPSITVRECSIVVDLFRMMPAEVFFNNYESIVLTQ